MTRKTSTEAAIYQGPDLGSTVGETLREGAVVRVIQRRNIWGAELALVDMPSTEWGTGRTYTVWQVAATELAPWKDPR